MLGAVLVAAVGCGGGPRVLARGVLAYDVATAPGLEASVELETEFALVLRRGAQVARVPLGPAEYDVVDLAVDGAGKLAAVACLDGTVRVHDATTGAERARWRLDAAATAVALSPDGRYVVTGAATGVMCLRRVEDGALLQCVAEHAARITSLATTADRLASADEAGHVVVWRVPSLHILERRDGGRAVAFEGERVVTAAAPLAPTRAGLAVVDGRRVLLAGKPFATFAGPVRGLAVSPDGRWLYVAGFTSRDLRAPALSALRLP